MTKTKPKLPVRQLLILSICRFAEPVVLTSVLPYLPEMMEYVKVPERQIAKWVGISSAIVAICQCVMAVPWGLLSDYIGRKPVILFGLSCTMIFSLMFGFSSSLAMLLTARALLGLMNGNVGIIRTMVAEMVPERELQPRAFSVMPLVWTIGSILGPAFGGALANPVKKHPEIFGNSEFLRKYPFALPSLLSAVLFVIGLLTGFLFMEETLATRKDKRDYGRVLGEMLVRPCSRKRRPKYRFYKEDGGESTALLAGDEYFESDAEFDSDGEPFPRKPTAAVKQISAPKKAIRPPTWSQVFTPQSNLVLLAYAALALHSMAFDALLPVFLYHPVQDLDDPRVKLPFKFSGGYGVDSQAIGLMYMFVSMIGMVFQFVLFPPTAKRYGVLNCLKFVAIMFPIVYAITPFSVLLPQSVRYVAAFVLIMGKMVAGIFAFPCSTILLTNSASSLNVLGTLNGVGTSFSAIGRAVGPAIVGFAFTAGVGQGYVVVPWFVLAGLGALSAIPVFWVDESTIFGPSEEDQSSEETDVEEDDEYHDEVSITYGTLENGSEGRRL